jgi:translation initiation factor eIF-2B subunit beta
VEGTEEGGKRGEGGRPGSGRCGRDHTLVHCTRVVTMVDVVIAAEGLPKLQPGLRRAVEAYYTKLKRRQSTTNLGNARETAELLRSVVGSNVWSVTAELLRLVRVIGCYLVTADPLQFSVGNVVRRVLKIIREEYAATAASSATTEASSSAAAAAATAKHGGAEAAEKASDAAVTASLANLLVSPLLGAEPMNYQRAYDVKGPIIEAIKELLDELEVLYKNVSEQAINHIHADEVVMTLGQSDLVTAFLTEVHAKKRTFEVFVAEAAPECSGQQMAAELARGGIRATLISDAAIFALMARVDKVWPLHRQLLCGLRDGVPWCTGNCARGAPMRWPVRCGR